MPNPLKTATSFVFDIPTSHSQLLSPANLFDCELCTKNNKDLSTIEASQKQLTQVVLKQEYLKVISGLLVLALVGYLMANFYDVYNYYLQREFAFNMEIYSRLGIEYIRDSKLYLFDDKVPNLKSSELGLLFKSITGNMLGPIGGLFVILSLITGGVISILKRNSTSLLVWGIVAFFIHQAPVVGSFIINQVNMPEYDYSTIPDGFRLEPISKFVPKLNKELIANKGLKLAVDTQYTKQYPGRTINQDSISIVEEYMQERSDVLELHTQMKQVSSKSDKLKSFVYSKLSTIVGCILGVGLILPILATRRKIKKIKM